MEIPQKIQQNIKQQIDLHIGGQESSLIPYNVELLASRIMTSKLVFVDSGVLKSLQKNAENGNSESKILLNVLMKHSLIVVPGGEQAKKHAVHNLLLDSLFQHAVLRSDSIMVIGGGALCDTVGFAASVYMRGISVSFVPSTLLAMVDASIGGKTAVNYRQWKNMVGTFYPAKEVFIMPFFLQFLPTALLKEGSAEIIKAGMLQDEKILLLFENEKASLFDTQSERFGSLWEEIVWRAIQVKVSIVSEDFQERTIRSFLNLGHTFAHAQEAYYKKLGKRISHGDAVSLGMRAALTLGLQLRKDTVQEAIQKAGGEFTGDSYIVDELQDDEVLTNDIYAKRIFSLLESLEYPKNYIDCNAEELVNEMYVDKKRNAIGLRFILQHSHAKTLLLPILREEIIHTFKLLGAE